MSGREACAHCGGTGWAKQVDGKAKLEELWGVVRRQGIVVSNGDSVSSDEAAKLMGRKPQTLQNWRWLKSPDIPYVRRNRRVFYKLADIADYLASIETTSMADLEDD